MLRLFRIVGFRSRNRATSVYVSPVLRLGSETETVVCIADYNYRRFSFYLAIRYCRMTGSGLSADTTVVPVASQSCRSQAHTMISRKRELNEISGLQNG